MIDVSSWEKFKIGELFNISGTKTTKIDTLKEYGSGAYPYITTQSSNNGVEGFYDYWTEQGKVLVIDSAVAGFCSYQDKNFSASDHVEKLVPLFPINKYTGLFIATIINLDRYRYNYGRKFNQKKIKETIIKLPADKAHYPDWIYMENYIVSLLDYSRIETKIERKELPLDVSKWNKFKMDDIFIFYKGKRIIKEDMTPGNTNFVASIDNNNGIREKIDIIPAHQGNCITVNYNGSVGEAFYQNAPFCASDDVNILYPKDWILNKYIGLFLVTIIRFNKYRFGYGRKWKLDKMKETLITLPSTNNNVPDWQFMESYIRSLPYSDKI